MVAERKVDASPSEAVCVARTVSVTTTLLCVGIVKESSVSQQRRLLLPQQ